MARRAAPCLALSASLLALPAAARAAEPADLVLENAVVHTVDAKRPAILHVTVSSKIIEGSPANSIDVVPVQPWPQTP